MSFKTVSANSTVNEPLGRPTLPKDWVWVRVGDFCRLVNGDAYKPSDWSTRGVPIIRIQNLNDPTKPFNYWAGSLDDRVKVKTGDILLAWSGTPGTSFGAHLWNRGDGILNQHIFRVDLHENYVLPEWFVFAVNQRLDVLIGKAHGGVGLRHVTKGEVEKLEIPLPPTGEQARITTILTQSIRGIERARVAAEEQLEAAETLPGAYLHAIFGSAEAKKWPERRIRDFAETGSGSTPSRTRTDYYMGTIPWIKTGELKDGAINDSEEHVSEAALRDTSLRLLPAGTLLIAMYGQGQTRGRTGILTIPATTNQACFAILPNPTKFHSMYLQLWFRYSYYRLRRETEGRGGNQPNLNGVVLGNQLVPLPPMNIQNCIVAEINEQMSGASQAVKAISDTLRVINKLPAALLREAFAGRL